MKFLLDVGCEKVAEKMIKFPGLVSGQLQTPLTNYATWGGSFAVDNGAFSGLDVKKFVKVLNKVRPEKERCLFVASPDVVGDARRTLELFDIWYSRLQPALVSVLLWS